MLSVAEISDRLEIQQLLVDYSSAIDQRRFDDLDRVFTPDAYIDYRALGGIDGRYPKIKQWLSQVLGNFPVYAHMLGNFSVRVDGDTASSRVICFNPMVFAGDRQQVLFCGLWYDDDFVRTPDGWRIIRRVETKCFQKMMRSPLGELLPQHHVLAQLAAVHRATTCPVRGCRPVVIHARQNRIRASRPGR